MKLDAEYLCSIISSLSGIPVRLYEGDQLLLYCSVIDLPRDPMLVYKEEIWQLNRSVGYFVTRHFNYYGIVRFGEKRLIIGPSRQVDNSDQELHELAFRADVPPDKTENFISGMKSIIFMPLESILQILCAVNYVINGEKLGLKDVMILDEQQDRMRRMAVRLREQRQDVPAGPEPAQDLHNTYNLEQNMLNIVQHGDTAAMREWISSAPAVRSGVMAAEQLRQQKNIFIVTATLVSRAAIRGGMTVEEAFIRSDSYIRNCELMSTPTQIINLQYHMVLDYTESVERIRMGLQPTRLQLDVANYVQHHLSEPISAQALADSLFVSRSYLSRRFHAETGMTLTEFIQKEKTEEAKRLLRYTDKSLGAISAYLGFSSQSHFARVFKQVTGKTPSECR